MTNVKDRVVEVVSNMAVVKEGIRQEDKLSEIGINSLSVVDLIIALEDELGIHFKSSDLNPAQIQTVQDIIKLVDNYI